ncbi:MAG: hypothetical protein Ct9H300mP12_06560 [Acidimicrobiales bacterium]|nr:MAG: hypothetical protein Ct9H300mP12_06560 [Acidimicrobiales bacterium]
MRRAIGIYRSLREAGVVVELDEPDNEGRHVSVGVDLQDRFALHQPLSLFALEVTPERVDPPEPELQPGPEKALGEGVQAARHAEPEAAAREHAWTCCRLWSRCWRTRA